MKLKTPTLFLWVVLIAGAAIAGEQRQSPMQIVVEDDTTAAKSFLFDGEDAGLDLNGPPHDEMHGDHEVRSFSERLT